MLAYATATIEPPRESIGLSPQRISCTRRPRRAEGASCSAEFPPDHAHQHGGFFAWVNTTFDGHKVDFWNQKDRLGRVRHIDVVDFESGPVFAGFTARLRHEDISRPGDPIPALDEVWNIRAYRIGPHHVVDFESAQKCAGDRPLRMNKYHYGGFGIRGNSAWYDPQSTGETPPDPERSGKAEFLTSEGKHRLEGNHSRPRWVDLSGMLEGAFAGVTVLDHPTNFRFPQPVRLHPNKPYFCFAPMVEGEFRIEPGSTYVSRYRLILHDGPPEVAAIERLYDDYRDPPTVRLLAKE
ncbi:MAG: PmoA family protein [Isosphaeraceae bacterium]